MGAAGYVTAYDLNEVERRYAEMWPDNDLNADLWYLNDPDRHDHSKNECWPTEPDAESPCRKAEPGYRKLALTTPNGDRLLLDYADDQGGQEGLDNSFWFASADLVDRPEWMGKWQFEEPWRGGAAQEGKVEGSQMRVHAVLRECQWRQTTEVWT